MSPNPIQSCSYCTFPATTRCGGCQVIPYCGKACQKAEWHIHKKHCKILKEHPPPTGFIPNLTGYGFINLTKIGTYGRPVYPTPWALEANPDAEFDTPPRTAKDSDDSTDEHKRRVLQIHGVQGWPRARQLMRETADRSMARVTAYKGISDYGRLSRDQMNMRVVDAYRTYCFETLKIHSGNERLIKVHTPSEAGFRDYFLHPLLSLTGRTRAIVVPPHFPSTPSSAPSVLAGILKTTSKYSGARIEGPVGEEEYDSVMMFGEEDSLKNICKGVRQGLRGEGALRWIIEAEGGSQVWEKGVWGLKEWMG